MALENSGAPPSIAEDRPADFVRRLGLEFWVAEHDGEPAGLVYWAGDFVHSPHVLGRHSRKGVGGRLMNLAESEMAQAGFAEAKWETDTFNARSRAFYERRGYRESNRYPAEEWKSGLVTLPMVKRLGSRHSIASRRNALRHIFDVDASL